MTISNSVILFLLIVLVLSISINAKENEKIKGKTAFITGATSGIGKAVAEYLASRGVNVVLLGRRQEKGKQVEQDINSKGKGKALFVKGDVTIVEDQRKALKEGANKFGTINFALANAGTGNLQSPEVHDLDDARRIIDVNFFGSLITLQESSKYFKKNEDGGVIVYTSSMGATVPRDAFAAPETGFHTFSMYDISKEAQSVLTRTSAALDAMYKIKSYSLQPAVFSSEMVDLATKLLSITEAQFAQGNPLLKGLPGNPTDLGRAIEACFDGTTNYKSGTGFVVDNFVSWPSQLFYNGIEGSGVSRETLIKEARDLKGNEIDLTEEKVEKILKKQIFHDEL